MKKKNTKTEIDFSSVTPRMQIKRVKFSKIYKRALLNRDCRCKSDYCRNTSSED